MPNAPFAGKRCRAVNGAALVIVLFFVVLLSIVAIAFLSRSLTAIKVSAGSVGETKSHILASSAGDTIIGDLKQEIIAGSTNFAGGSNPNSGNAAFPVYTPTANTTAIPFMTGVPAANAIPNLISRSVSPANTGSAPPVAYPGIYTSTLTPPNRAAVDSSTKINSATTSLNGRSVPPDIWNEHYLIPRLNPGTSTTTTPVSTFVPPDWVVVTRGGINSVSWSSGSGGLNDSTLSNTNCAVGRYAYAVYNEGGLLDMNAAGYPGTDTGSGSVGLTSAQASNKSSLSLADLTQLTVGTASLTQAQVNNLVGWRNYASVQPPAPGGSFGNFTFTQANASRWLTNFVTGNTNGYMQIVPTPSGVTTPPTDQVFLSRQQLISVIQSLNINSDFLQYMGTFSRGLEQPSYVANPHLPAIVGTISPPPTSAVNTYQGNNTYFQGESAINLRGTAGFLGIRVGTSPTSTFTRLDGTTAIAGEPLIKRKFALSRLALVTTNYGATFSSAAAAAAANDPVYQRFGIYRSSTSSPWIYDHGIAGTGTPSNGTTTPAIIGTLTQVAALSGSAGTTTAAREPDFAELLKAAINVGSVGKAGPSSQGVEDQYREDTSGDVQILKIMADLIDQQKTDNYPTWIQYNQTVSTGSVVPRNMYGDQDLPYFYRYNYFNVTTHQPSPLLASTDTVQFVLGTPTPTGTITLNHTRQGSVSDTGTGTYLLIPQIWNPHDANTPQAANGGPTQFQIIVQTNLPAALGGTSNTAWQITTVPCTQSKDNALITFDGENLSGTGSFTNANCPQANLASPYTSTLTMTAANSFIQFTDNSAGKAFREPTLLWRSTPNVSLTGTLVTDALTSNPYYGIFVGNVPISWNWTGPDGKSYFSQASNLQAGQDQAGGSGTNPSNFDIQMQYKNAANNWITYQECYVEYTLTDYPSYSVFVNPNEPAYTSSSSYQYNAWKNPFAPGVNSNNSPPFSRQQSGLYDPRTDRFSAPVAMHSNSDDPTQNGNPTLETTVLSANNVVGSLNGLVSNNFVLLKTNRPTTSRGQFWEYTTPCHGNDSTMHWYSSLSTCSYSGGFTHGGTDADCFDGLLSQNNPMAKVLCDSSAGAFGYGIAGSTPQSYYYEDPDGIARRAMGGYVPVSGTPTGSLTNTTTTIGLPEVTSGTATPVNGIEVPTTQSQSRPILLHRPFQSVAEMSYAFRGSPWKSIDFFTPESGDTALLDVFCVNEPPSNAIVAGKVDLNTRQAPVLKAILNSAYRDEFANIASPPSSGTLPPLSSTEAGNLANTLVGITTSSNAWEGPLSSIADLVGHFVYPDPGTLSATDVYQYTSPANSTEYTFSGFSAALSSTSGIWDSANLTSSQNIQRFRECAVRPLTAAGQTRVWNLLLDVVAQTGHYPKTATGFDQFIVEGQTHLWVHVAIDRFTGQVIDKQVETVTP
jgi:hypothetical protein